MIGLRDKLVERRLVDDLGSGISSFLHDGSDHAGSFIRTIIAARITFSPDARDSCKGTVDKPHDFAEGDGIGRTLEQVAAFFSFAALQGTAIATLEQDRLEDFARSLDEILNVPDGRYP